MQILSTLKFPVTTANGIIPKTTLQTVPVVTDGVVSGLPSAADGVLWFVNAAVFAAAPSRTDLIMFDPAQTLRDADDKPCGQGGFLKRDGSAHQF